MSAHKHARGEVEVVNPDEWEDGLRFGLKTLNTKSVRRAKTPDDVLLVCLQHNLRKGNDGHRHRRRIDTARSASNTVLLGPADPEVGAELARGILHELGIVPPRRDSIMAVEAAFQPSPGWDRPEFYETCLGWARRRYAFIVSAVVHRDQRRPHLHVLALAIVDGRLDGAAMTSGQNRLEAQRSEFMAHLRVALGLRPDRNPKQVSKSMASIFTSAGKGPKTHESAARRDAEMEQRASAGAIDLIAQQPHSPSPSPSEQPHGRADLIAPTSYCAALSTANRLFAEGVSAGLIPRSPLKLITTAPIPGNAAAGSSTSPSLRLVIGSRPNPSIEAAELQSPGGATIARPFVIPASLAIVGAARGNIASASRPTASRPDGMRAAPMERTA